MCVFVLCRVIVCVGCFGCVVIGVLLCVVVLSWCFDFVVWFDVLCCFVLLFRCAAFGLFMLLCVGVCCVVLCCVFVLVC